MEDAGIVFFDLDSIDDTIAELWLKHEEALKAIKEGRDPGKNVIVVDADPELVKEMEARREEEDALFDPRPKITSACEPDGVPKIYIFDELPDVTNLAVTDLAAVKKKAVKVVEIKDPDSVRFLTRVDERYLKYLRARGIPEGTNLTLPGYEEENAELEKIQWEEAKRIWAEMEAERYGDGHKKDD